MGRKRVLTKRAYKFTNSSVPQCFEEIFLFVWAILLITEINKLDPIISGHMAECGIVGRIKDIIADLISRSRNSILIYSNKV